MDWCVAGTYSKANHPPKVALKHSNEIIVRSGSEVVLSGEASDPDNNALNCRWFLYEEPGSPNSNEFELQNPDSKEVKFVASIVSEPGTMHFILELTDNSTPNLTRYQRTIVNLTPK